jgi:membrane protease YdiL (CAAX protease family)
MTTAPAESAAALGWPAPTKRSQRWSARYARAALVLVTVGVHTLGFALDELGIGTPYGLWIVIVEASFLAALVPLYRAGSLRPVDLGLRTVPPARSVGYAMLGLFAYGWSSALWHSLVHPPPVHSNFVGVANQSTALIVLTGFAAVVAAPVAEEIFFRGFLYRSLRNRMAIVPACLIVGFVFGLGHTQYPLLVRPVLGAFGVIACLLYERTGSLLPGIAMHSFVDSSGFEYALTGRVNIVFDASLLLALILLIAGFIKTIGRPKTPTELPHESSLQRMRKRAIESHVSSEG